MKNILTKLKPQLEKLNCLTIQNYLTNKNWKKIKSKRENLVIFLYEQTNPLEILLPLDRNFIDYYELIYNAVYQISIAENREIENVIFELVLPPSDIIKFRVNNKNTELGLISINDGLILIENAKKSLYTIACDTIKPEKYHKKNYYKKAEEFINTCFLGQTEKGSFIASVICPFIDNVKDKNSLNELFKNENYEKNNINFTRNVTERYMKSLIKIKESIQSGNEEKLLEHNKNDEVISANFIECIYNLSILESDEILEISSNWSNLSNEIPKIKSSVTFTKDYISPMKSIVSKLKPINYNKEVSYYGKISKAEVDPNPNFRDKSEIVFNFMSENNKLGKAKVFLDNVDFSKALEAFKNGYNVKISGNLKNDNRTKVIEDPIFELLDD